MLPQDFVADCLGFRATRVRRIRARVYARYAFLFTPESEVVYESDQGSIRQRTGRADGSARS